MAGQKNVTRYSGLTGIWAKIRDDCRGQRGQPFYNSDAAQATCKNDAPGYGTSQKLQGRVDVQLGL